MYANDLRRSALHFMVLLLVGGIGSACDESGAQAVRDAAMSVDGPSSSGAGGAGGTAGDGAGGKGGAGGTFSGETWRGDTRFVNPA